MDCCNLLRMSLAVSVFALPADLDVAQLCFTNAPLLTYLLGKYSKYTTVTIKYSDFKLTQNAANAEPQK